MCLKIETSLKDKIFPHRLVLENENKVRFPLQERCLMMHLNESVLLVQTQPIEQPNMRKVAIIHVFIIYTNKAFPSSAAT